MERLIGILIALAASAPFAAETYKWVDDKGVTTYGAKPPAGRRATPVDTTPSGPTGSSAAGNPQDKPEAGQRRQAEAPPPPPPQQARASIPPAAAAAPARGMEFETFIRLQRGMSEGELMLRAGRPDHESLENFRHDIVKTWYYFPTTANPFTTVVTVRGGRIANLDRVKRF